MKQSKFDLFLNMIREEVFFNREILGEGLRKSFVLTVSSRLPDNCLEDINLLYVRDKFRNRLVSIDGYAFNSEENTLYLIVADWNDFEATNNLTQTDAEALLRQLRAFFEFSRSGQIQDPASGILEFSTPEYGLAELINSEAIDRVELMIFTDRRMSDRLRSLSSPELGGIPSQAQIWSLERLFEFYQSGLDHEPIELDFSDTPIALTEAASGEGFKSYLGVMPAHLLAYLYQTYGGRLLEGNVRSFLTLKSHVNRDIRGTILGHPERFFIYNNGIAVTAKKLRFNRKHELISASDFQIINGGQTTASLANAVHNDKADVSGISVALKLTEIDDSIDEVLAQQLTRDISRYSNNQNKVSGADFSSNHEDVRNFVSMG